MASFNTRGLVGVATAAGGEALRAVAATLKEPVSGDVGAISAYLCDLIEPFSVRWHLFGLSVSSVGGPSGPSRGRFMPVENSASHWDGGLSKEGLGTGPVENSASRSKEDGVSRRRGDAVFRRRIKAGRGGSGVLAGSRAMGSGSASTSFIWGGQGWAVAGGLALVCRFFFRFAVTAGKSLSGAHFPVLMQVSSHCHRGHDIHETTPEHHKGSTNTGPSIPSTSLHTIKVHSTYLGLYDGNTIVFSPGVLGSLGDGGDKMCHGTNSKLRGLYGPKALNDARHCLSCL